MEVRFVITVFLDGMLKINGKDCVVTGVGVVNNKNDEGQAGAPVRDQLRRRTQG